MKSQHPSQNISEDTHPFCYCYHLRKLGKKCHGIHLPSRLLNENGWLARCNHPGCKEIFIVTDNMRTISSLKFLSYNLQNSNIMYYY